MDGDGRRMVLSRFTVPYLHANCGSPDVRRVSEDGNEGQEEKEDVGGGAHRFGRKVESLLFDLID